MLGWEDMIRRLHMDWELKDENQWPMLRAGKGVCRVGWSWVRKGLSAFRRNRKETSEDGWQWATERVIWNKDRGQGSDQITQDLKDMVQSLDLISRAVRSYEGVLSKKVVWFYLYFIKITQLHWSFFYQFLVFLLPLFFFMVQDPKLLDILGETRAWACQCCLPCVPSSSTREAQRCSINTWWISEKTNLNISLSYMKSAITRFLQPKMWLENILIPSRKYNLGISRAQLFPEFLQNFSHAHFAIVLLISSSPHELLSCHSFPFIYNCLYPKSLSGISSIPYLLPFLSVPATAPVQTLSGELCLTL